MTVDKFTVLLKELRDLDADLEAPELKYKVAELLDMVYETVSTMHKNQQDDKDEIDNMKRVINTGAPGGAIDKYKKGILEYKVIQNIKPLTGEKTPVSPMASETDKCAFYDKRRSLRSHKRH